MRQRAVLCVVTTLAGVACSDANLAEPEGLGLEAAGYLNFALDVMEFNSIRKYEIDWVDFRAQALEDAGNAKTAADTYATIELTLERLGDNHSFFQPPDGPSLVRQPTRPSPPAAVDPTSELIEATIGYVDVPAFSGGGAAADELASLYHDVIERVDTIDVCRWVVDVRGNAGGNMWPMLAGVGPILGEGIAGFFVDPDSIVSEWSYEGGSASLDGAPLVTASPAYELDVPLPPVAVLTDSLTASSGEAIVVAFRARAGARSFGRPTFGVSTANAGFVLPDNAVIFLTVAWMADRSGEIYGSRLDPDSLVAGTKTGNRSTDAALDAALDWLATQACG